MLNKKDGLLFLKLRVRQEVVLKIVYIHRSLNMVTLKLLGYLHGEDKYKAQQFSLGISLSQSCEFESCWGR